MCYGLSTPVSAAIADRLTLRQTLLFGSALAVSSAAMRVAAIPPTMEWLVIVAHCVLGVAMPLLTFSTMTRLTSQWFPEKQRAIADALAFLSNPIGCAACYAIVPSLITRPTRDQFEWLTIAELVATLLAAGLLALFFSSEPKLPPSVSQAIRRRDRAHAADKWTLRGYAASVRDCFRDVHFVLLFVSYGLGFGLVNGLCVTMNELLVPLGYTAPQAGIAGVVFLVAGMAGAMASGFLMDMFRHYAAVIRTMLALSVVTAVGVYFCMRPDFLAVLLAALGVHALCTFAIVAPALEAAVEVTYPIPPATSSSILNMAGFFCTAAIVPMLGACGGAKTALCPWLGLWAVAAVAGWLFNGRYKRLEVETAARETR